jgi:MFS family permease
MSDKILTDTYNHQIEKNYKWNFFWFTVDNMMFFFIFMGLSPYTVLPFYLKHFTNSNILIALIPAIHILGNSLPQIFMARFLKKTDERKKHLFLIASVQRFGILGMLLLVILQPILGISSTLTVVLFFATLGIQTIASGFYLPTWLDFLGKSIPTRRGLLFGVSNFFGGLMGLGIGWLLSFLLDRFPFYQAMPWIVGISFAASMVSLLAIWLWRETLPPRHVTEAAQQVSSRKTILGDSNFIKFLVWRGVMVMLDIATPFYALSALERLKLADSQIGVFTVLLSLSETVLNPLWGWMGDHKGFFNIVLISAAAGSLAAFLAATAPSLFVYYLIFLLAGVMISGLQISNFNIIFEFSPAHLVPMYTAVSQMALTPLSGVIPVLGGLIADKLGYISDFWLAGIVGVVSLTGIWVGVRNPKKSQVLNINKSEKPLA